MKIYLLLLNLLFPLPFAFADAPNPPVLYPMGSVQDVRQGMIWRADRYQGEAARLQAIVKKGSYTTEIQTTVKLTKTEKANLNKQIKSLQAKAKAARDSAR